MSDLRNDHSGRSDQISNGKKSAPNQELIERKISQRIVGSTGRISNSIKGDHLLQIEESNTRKYTRTINIRIKKSSSAHLPSKSETLQNKKIKLNSRRSSEEFKLLLKPRKKEFQRLLRSSTNNSFNNTSYQVCWT